MRIIFTLLDMKCEELHGDLSQEQVRNSIVLNLHPIYSSCRYLSASTR
jgi:hypothetical protein